VISDGMKFDVRVKRSGPLFGKKTTESGKAISLSQEGKLGCGCFGYFFFGIFLLVGTVNTYFFLVQPLNSYLAVQEWEETPCEILECKVRRAGDNYRIDVAYRYQFAGEEFQAARYHPAGFVNADQVSDRRLEQELKPGTETVCYVNPETPDEAVLNRDFSWWILLGIVPAGFALFGAFGLIMIPILGRRVREASSNGIPDFQDLGQTLSRLTAVIGQEDVQASLVTRPGPSGWELQEDARRDWLPPLPGGPQELKSASSPRGMFLGILFFALIWNGIISVFLVSLYNDWQAGRGDWIPTLFMIPFVAVGCGFLCAAVYYFLAMFNPRPQLVISNGRPTLGDVLRIKWVLHGRVHKIRQFNLKLLGEEEAVYRRGTSTYTDNKTFFEEVIYSTHDPFEMESGDTELQLPTNTMHTFHASNNKIKWSLVLHGDIALWPDVHQKYEIALLPPTPDQMNG